MAKYLISFPAEAMAMLTQAELALASIDSHAVIEAAKAAGVYVFGGGIDEQVPSVTVSADGTITADSDIRPLTGGFTVLELLTLDDAVAWAARLAAACRCPQQLRAFMYNAAS